MEKKYSITAMVLGIVSILLGCNGILAFGLSSNGIGSLSVVAIGGIVCAILSMNFCKKAIAIGGENSFNKTGKITSIIGLIISILGLVGGILCTIVTCSAYMIPLMFFNF